MAQLHLLSAGAAKGLVGALQGEFECSSGHRLHASFGAVGAMHEQLDRGAPCDAIVLTRAMLDALAAAGRVVPTSVADLGLVRTGVAVPQGAAVPAITDANALRTALAAATAIHLPDPERATAGRHALRVITELGLLPAAAERLRVQPNGAAAMAALALDAAAGAIGITQVTEILYTPGVVLVSALPPPFELATLYSAGVMASSAQREAARLLVHRLTSSAGAAARQQAGFERP